jgi:para-nitrobenzyl esterase
LRTGVLLLAALLVACAPKAEADPHVVQTSAGKLRGEHAAIDGVYVFKGVPYGASTAGSARFKPPQPAASWDGVRDATAYGPYCPQLGDAAKRPRPGADGTVRELAASEDCLVLNVWTPDLDPKAARPVMVWLHGRGYSAGAGSEPLYDGRDLARRGNLVVIGLNHRLNIFGYLNLEEIGGEAFAGSGVAGLLDVELALRWVRDNVAAFGGDPGNVTIFGESGGGSKVSTIRPRGCSIAASSRAVPVCAAFRPSRGPRPRAR